MNEPSRTRRTVNKAVTQKASPLENTLHPRSSKIDILQRGVIGAEAEVKEATMQAILINGQRAAAKQLLKRAKKHAKEARHTLKEAMPHSDDAPSFGLEDRSAINGHSKEFHNGSNGNPEPLSSKQYEKELKKLQAELCYLQDWVKEKGVRVVVIFEGRDAAGKGGTIRALTARVSPRVFRVVALTPPSDREKTNF
jgi:polyphosphate kinase 2 (PPK2 family)